MQRTPMFVPRRAYFFHTSRKIHLSGLFQAALRGGVALAVLAMVACSDTPWTWVALDRSPEGTPVEVKVDDQNSSASKTVLAVSVHGYWQRPRLGADGEFYTEIRVPGMGAHPVSGAPSVPVLKLALAIPDGVKTEENDGSNWLRTEVDEIETVQIAVEKLWPVVIGETDQAVQGSGHEKNVSTPEEFVINPQFYALDEPWPTKESVLETRSGRRLRSIESVEVTLSPVRWSSRDRVLEIVPNMMLTVHHNLDPIPTQPITPEREKLARNEFYNWHKVAEFFPIDYFYRADYLIIYPNDDYADEIAPLADQKRARGYRVTEMTVEDIGGTCRQIRAAIQAWEATRAAWRDTYALLVGDTDVIPLCTSPTGDPTDDLYASTNGDDQDEEIFLGRLSIDDEADLAEQIDKILAYEDEPAVFCCYDQVALWAHKEGAPGKYEGAHEAVRTYDYSTPPNFITYYGSQDDVEDPDIQNEVDGGVGVLAYRGHGSRSSTATRWNQISDSFDGPDVVALNNNINQSPVTWAFACSNSALDWDDSIAEIWMEQVGTGSVSYYGATVPSFTSQNHVLDEWMFRAVYDEGLTKQSHAIRRAEAQMTDLSGDDNAWMYLLLGDPDMDIRRRNPYQIIVGKPDIWRICKQDDCMIDFFITHSDGEPIPDARVSLWKDDLLNDSDGEIFNNGYTDAAGRIQLQANALTLGDIHFSVQDLEGGSVRGVIEVVSESASESSGPNSQL